MPTKIEKWLAQAPQLQVNIGTLHCGYEPGGIAIYATHGELHLSLQGAKDLLACLTKLLEEAS